METKQWKRSKTFCWNIITPDGVIDCLTRDNADLIIQAPDLLAKVLEQEKEIERLKEDSNKDLFVIGSQLQELERLREERKDLVEALKKRKNDRQSDFHLFVNSLKESNTFGGTIQNEINFLQSLLSKFEVPNQS